MGGGGLSPLPSPAPQKGLDQYLYTHYGMSMQDGAVSPSLAMSLLLSLWPKPMQHKQFNLPSQPASQSAHLLNHPKTTE